MCTILYLCSIGTRIDIRKQCFISALFCQKTMLTGELCVQIRFRGLESRGQRIKGSK
jgi:hypothetical protein